MRAALTRIVFIAIWIEETDEVFFASMGGQPQRSRSDLSRNNKIFRICLKDLKPGTPRDQAVTEVGGSPDAKVPMVEANTASVLAAN